MVVIDQAVCPLCGGPNECLHARPCEGEGPCWCIEFVFPKELLDLVPDEAKRRACICRRCLERYCAERGVPVQRHPEQVRRALEELQRGT
ncbi:MAG: cysteine-rich CWC family protein [Verrucomicrobiae bacterium]|nr:cysteine-rich CWC family protein [Verrucomicrobiae bacterium]